MKWQKALDQCVGHKPLLLRPQTNSFTKRLQANLQFPLSNTQIRKSNFYFWNLIHSHSVLSGMTVSNKYRSSGFSSNFSKIPTELELAVLSILLLFGAKICCCTKGEKAHHSHTHFSKIIVIIQIFRIKLTTFVICKMSNSKSTCCEHKTCSSAK